MYHGKYVVARIEDFIAGPDTYKVEQRDTTWLIKLSYREEPKQFKLNLISDKPPTENEYIALQNYQKLNLSQEYVKFRLKELISAQKFLYDAEELTRMVKLQNYQRIKAGNFKGLNLRDISICLQGEIALAQAALAENESRNDVSQRGLNDLRQKIEELSDLLKIVDEQVVKDVNHLASKDIKMGAKLNQVGELEEWLQLQKGFNDAQKNNNIFTYKNVKLRQQRSTEITDLSLIEELQRL